MSEAFTEKVYTIRETAQVLRVDYRTILRMIASGEIEAFRVGGRWRIRENVVKSLMGIE